MADADADADTDAGGPLARRVQRLLRRLVEVRPDEVGPLVAAFAFFFCLLAAYYLLRPLRDALGLAGGVGNLPWLFSATFVVMLAAVPAFGALAARLPPRRFVPIVYRFFAASFVGFAALLAAGTAPVAVGRAFFVWISVFNLFVVSVFWSVLADRFDNAQARRLYGFIAAGGTAGTLAGPALAALLAPRLDPQALTLAAVLLLEAAVQCFRRLDRGRAPPAGQGGRVADGMPVGGGARPADDGRLGGGAIAGITLIARSRYLQGMALYLLLGTVTATLLYVEQGRIVADRFADTASRTQFFAQVDLAVSALTLVLQTAVVGRLLRRLGVATALMALPAAVVAAFALVALAPGPAALAVAQMLRRATEYAVARPAREVLYTVVGREAKYKAKAVIETVVYRGGDAATGWLATALGAAGVGFQALALAVLPLAAGWAALGVWLGRRQDERLARRGPADGEP